jgi:hypothetical protein
MPTHSQTAGCIPVPDVPNNIEFRVAGVVNSNFPELTAQQIQRLLDAARTTVKDQFQKDISFSAVREIAVQDFFELRRLPPKATTALRDGIVDFKHGNIRRDVMVNSFVAQLQRGKEDPKELLTYAPRAEYTPPVPAWKTFKEFRDSLPARDRGDGEQA